jgi:hypothetical protein
MTSVGGPAGPYRPGTHRSNPQTISGTRNLRVVVRRTPS